VTSGHYNTDMTAFAQPRMQSATITKSSSQNDSEKAFDDEFDLLLKDLSDDSPESPPPPSTSSSSTSSSSSVPVSTPAPQEPTYSNMNTNNMTSYNERVESPGPSRVEQPATTTSKTAEEEEEEEFSMWLEQQLAREDKQAAQKEMEAASASVISQPVPVPEPVSVSTPVPTPTPVQLTSTSPPSASASFLNKTVPGSVKLTSEYLFSMNFHGNFSHNFSVNYKGSKNTFTLDPNMGVSEALAYCVKYVSLT
jgi:hypothetical protein